MLIIVCFVIVYIALLGIFLTIKLNSTGKPKIIVHEDERYYLDPVTEERLPFPPLMSDKEKEIPSKSEKYLSVIIPAYNEELRLPSMLDEALDYLERRSNETINQSTKVDSKVKDVGTSDVTWSCPKGEKFTYEIIIVDDGSRDKTTQIALQYSRKYGTDKVRVLTATKNRGKGGAVRLGVLSARGKLILFADADGATKFGDIEKLENYLYQSTDNEVDLINSIAIGSRAHLERQAMASRSIFRTILMLGFHFVVWFFTVRSVKDTQCGFKMFGRNIARILFNYMHVEKWAFDVELLYLAERINCNIGETAVNWTEIDGSKIVPVFSWLQMGKDVLSICMMYTIGAWTFPMIKDKDIKEKTF